MLSGTGLCDELITRLKDSYRLWCVVVCDQETFVGAVTSKIKKEERSFEVSGKD